jgi:hypothetical protein
MIHRAGTNIPGGRKVFVACWHIAPFRGGTEFGRFRRLSGHGRIFCWLDPVANDAEQTWLLPCLVVFSR